MIPVPTPNVGLAVGPLKEPFPKLMIKLVYLNDNGAQGGIEPPTP